jgi:hypothetical protein
MRLQSRFLLGLHVLEPLDGRLDRLEVGEHATQPTLVDKRHTGAAGFGSHNLARLALGAHHQDGAAVG